MADITVKIQFTQDAGGGHARPHPKRVEMNLGDRVRYISDPPDRSFRVVFSGNPYSSPGLVISDSNFRTVTQVGLTTCRCFITGPHGMEVGWSPSEVPKGESGGEHDVKPKPTG